ncbi:phage tail assembly chaperone [Agrobacterium tumefaciens]|uniref:rcc01693 family protein n=1 Tax=Agrobacterium tumefaciens TaxID=358 RepID=UPI001571C1D8|nr:rcc01693 family protein [Agrobacterium tumefaciens]NTE65612.1 phage tail assembly chaperone [Agrobacterium tumefaciens]
MGATSLRLLRLSPETFWLMTPSEFFAMTGGNAVSRGPDRQAMEGMMRQFPDG